MDNRKLRIGFVSNCPVGGKTGLGRNMKAILPLLWQSNKYEIFFLAQGMHDNDPNFQRLPFKCEGVFKNFDPQRFQQDQGYQRGIAYGNSAVEDFVIKNKLDALVLSDDIWAFTNECYLNTDWFQHIKQNVFPIITADSEFLLPQIKEWAEKCPNMKFWSEFPCRILKAENNEKFKHCEVVYGALDPEKFKPLLKHEKLEFRNKNNIHPEEKIIIYLGRNQLRKIFPANIEALAKFRKRHPDKKLRLLFHCSWGGEPGGWPLDQLRQNYGLKKEDILCTYYCRNCNYWNIQPFEGEELDCPHCNAKKSRITAGIGSTINEADLNKIYNLADGSSSVFTSGSFEFTNPESMLAGVPLAVPNYVCGEDFINSGFVYEIKGTKTFECGTGFLKFVADTNSVCNFFEYIYDLPEGKRRELINKARQWAIEKFDYRNIVKQYERLLDSCKPIDWEPYFNKKKELKDPHAQIQESPDDIEFTKQCYEKILKCPDVEKNDPGGYNHWIRFLQQPTDKNVLKRNMIEAFKVAAIQHNQKVSPELFSIENLLDKNDKSRVLLVLKESIGDHILLKSLLPQIKEKHHDSRIYIACDPKYNEVYEGSEIEVKCIPWSQELENELYVVGFNGQKGWFNHFYNIGLTSQRSLNYISSVY